MIWIIGYGNELRGDDALGPRVARQAASWNLPNVTALDLHQLTPELTETIIGAAAVLFVDAGRNADVVSLAPLAPHGSSDEPLALDPHALDPASLTALTRWLHGASPPAWMLTVPGSRFEFADQLSAEAAANMSTALGKVRQWIAGL